MNKREDDNKILMICLEIGRFSKTNERNNRKHKKEFNQMKKNPEMKRIRKTGMTSVTIGEPAKIRSKMVEN
jgi:uncharacterized membrane protein